MIPFFFFTFSAVRTNGLLRRPTRFRRAGGEEADAEIEFMTEDEQSDDPEGVEQWIDDLRSIPPVPENPEKEAEWRDWDEKMRQFNVEAVRKQFEEGTP